MLPDSVVVLFVIMGAGAACIVGYSIHRLFFGPSDFENSDRSPSTEQLQYMADVRRRNVEGLKFEANQGRSGTSTLATMVS
jgi:hypothetical protein